MQYDKMATPAIGEVIAGRPCYVPAKVLDAVVASGEWIRVWRLGPQVVSVETRDHAIVRRAEPWGQDLETAVAWWTAERLPAPSSPAGLAVDANFFAWYRGPAWSRHGFALRGFVGGWQEAKVVGVIAGPHRVYDLRRAYRWALTAAPFPDRATMRPAHHWTTDVAGLHLVTVHPIAGAPPPLNHGGRVLYEWPADAIYGVPHIERWHAGVTWTRTRETTELARWLDRCPVPAVARMYWGPWAASTAVSCTYHTGTVTSLRPRTADGVRAHLITARVRRRLAEIAAPYYYVDAVITSGTLPTGPAPGDWRLVREYRDGVHIRYPGGYGPPGARPDRLAGVHRVPASA